MHDVLTPEQYLEIERLAEYKTEYIAGQLRPMPPVSEAHNIITVNIAAELGAQLRGKDARAYVSNMRVRGSVNGPYFYPDVVAIQGDRDLEDEHKDTLTNPSVAIEVLSPESELYDRGEKFAHYQKLPSLTDYVLISQDKMRIEHYIRQDENHWLLSVTTEAHDELVLQSIDCALTLAAIYENVELAPVTPAP
jgi:Uma2 family endonuclease